MARADTMRAMRGMVADADMASKAECDARSGSRHDPRTRSTPRAVHGLFVTFGFVVAAFFPFLAIYLQGRGLSPTRSAW